MGGGFWDDLSMRNNKTVVLNSGPGDSIIG